MRSICRQMMFCSLRASQRSSVQIKILKGQSAQTTTRVVGVAYCLWLPFSIKVLYINQSVIYIWHSPLKDSLKRLQKVGLTGLVEFYYLYCNNKCYIYLYMCCVYIYICIYIYIYIIYIILYIYIYIYTHAFSLYKYLYMCICVYLYIHIYIIYMLISINNLI